MRVTEGKKGSVTWNRADKSECNYLYLYGI